MAVQHNLLIDKLDSILGLTLFPENGKEIAQSVESESSDNFLALKMTFFRILLRAALGKVWKMHVSEFFREVVID